MDTKDYIKGRQDAADEIYSEINDRIGQSPTYELPPAEDIVEIITTVRDKFA